MRRHAAAARREWRGEAAPPVTARGTEGGQSESGRTHHDSDNRIGITASKKKSVLRLSRPDWRQPVSDWARVEQETQPDWV